MRRPGCWIGWLAVVAACLGCGAGSTGADRGPADLPGDVADVRDGGDPGDPGEDDVPVVPDTPPPEVPRDVPSEPGDLPPEDLPDDPHGFHVLDLTAVGSVRGMWASADASIWAVGDAGLVLRWDGFDLVPVAPPPTRENLYGVAGEGGAVFAVGSRGTVLRWKDGAWTLLPPPSGDDLYGVGALSADEAYAVGAGGVVAHWSKGAWDVTHPGITYDLYGAWASPSGGVYAVGAYGTVLRLEGTTWVQAQAAAPGSRLRSIWRSPDGRMFTVGSGGAVAMHDGLTWKLQVTNDTYEPHRDLWGVFGFGPDEAYAVGDQGVVLRWDGKKWGTMQVAGPYNVQAGLRGVAGRLLPDGTRELIAAGLDGKAVRLDPAAGTWADRALGVTRDLHGVTATADGTLAVGQGGLLLTYADGRFGTLPAPVAEDLAAVSGPYAVGARGTLLRRDGDTFAAVDAGTAEDLTDVWAVADGAWAVGAAGTVVRVKDGVAQAGGLVPGVPLAAVWAASDSSVVVVAGANGTLRRNDGPGFAALETGTTSTLRDLWAAAPDAVYAVGDNGIVLRCGAAACQRVREDPATFLYGIGGDGPTLAVGWAGAVLRLEADGSFTPLDAGTWRVLRAVAGPAGGPLHLVGLDGAFAVWVP